MGIETPLIVLVYSYVCYSFGTAILLLLLRQRGYLCSLSTLGVISSAFAIGNGLLAIGWLFVLLAESLTWLVVVIVMGAVLAMSTAYNAGAEIQALGRLFQNFRQCWKTASPAWILIVVLVVLLVVVMGFASLLPPQPRGDALAFYMTLPKVAAATGELIPITNFESIEEMPLLGEMHFSALYVLDGETAAKLFVWVTSLFAGMALMSLARQAGADYRGLIFAFAGLTTSTAFSSNIWDGKVDVFGVGPLLMAVFWLLQIGEDDPDHRNRTLLRLAGLFAGLAIMAKFTYAVFLPLCLGLLLLWQLEIHRWIFRLSWAKIRWLAPLMVTFAFWALLPLLPNVLKNTVLYNLPLAPIINSQAGSALTASRFSEDVVRHINSIFPLAVTFGNYQYQHGNISPLVLGTIPLGVLAWRSLVRPGEPAFRLLIIGLIGLLLWIIVLPGMFMLRYFFPLLLLLSIWPAVAIGRVLEMPRRFGQIEGALVIAMVVLTLFSMSELRLNAVRGLQYANGNATACELEALNNDASCRMSTIINEHISPGERVFLASHFSYWLDPDILQFMTTVAGPRSPDSIRGARSNTELWQALFDEGFRYVMVDPYTHKAWDQKLDLSAVPASLKVEVVIAYEYGKLYRLDAAGE